MMANTIIAYLKQISKTLVLIPDKKTQGREAEPANR